MSYPEPPNGGPYPPVRDPRDYGDSQYPPPPSEYPPPPGEEDDRRAYNARMAQAMPQSNVTLPSISSPYDPQYAPPPPNGYAPDPRYRPEQQYHAGQPQPYPPQRGYPGDYPRGGPQHMQFATSAPRQRTAIACRYCRRRKVSKHFSGADVISQRGFEAAVKGSKEIAVLTSLPDPMLRLRGQPLRKVPELHAVPAGVHLHSSVISSTGVCASSCRLPTHASWSGWPTAYDVSSAALRCARPAFGTHAAAAWRTTSSTGLF